jgi:mycofactocin system glycosyltransferase
MVGRRLNRTEDQGQDLKPLAYRKRKTVIYHERNGSPVLVLHFPLKAIVLSPSWKIVLNLLSKGEFIPFKNIAPLVEHANPEKIEIFLDNLVRKGYLEREGVSTIHDYPFVSIIIAVRNRPEAIKACLQSLLEVDYPSSKMEIIVVDDASTDHTPDVVSTFPVQLISLKENKKAPFCRNLAAQRATGDIFGFIDSDCLADTLWLKELIPVFKDGSVGAVGGMVDAYSKEKALDRYEKVYSSLNMGSWFRRSSENDRFFYVPACNLFVRRDLFLSIGGFKEELIVGEDVDFCWRLQDNGHILEYRPIGKVYHKHRNRLKPFCLRRFDYGTSEPLLHLSHPRRLKEMIFLPGESLFWSAVVLSVILKSVPFLAVSGMIVLADTLIKFVRIRRETVQIGVVYTVFAVLRSYAAFFYHFCAFVSRYYLILGILIIPLLPLASMVIFGIHLLIVSVDYFIKKPRLNPISFLLYFSLEQLSYQLGVWWGCLKHFSFNSVNPRAIFRASLRRIK